MSANSDIIDNNYSWFNANLPNLVKLYDGKYIVIKGQKVINSYNSFDEAFVETTKNEIPGSFIIQLCSLDKEKTGQTFFSNRVTFS